MANKASNVLVRIETGTDRTLLATWACNNKNIDHYKVQWWFFTGNKDKKGNAIWIQGEDSEVTINQSVYDAPSNARQVRFRVKPIAKKHKVKGKQVAYWTVDWCKYAVHKFATYNPDTPSTPTVTINDFKLTAEVSYYGSGVTGADEIEFRVIEDNIKTKYTGKSSIKTNYASIQCDVDAGHEYKVQCRARKGTEYSNWSENSSSVGTIPSAPNGLRRVTNNVPASEVQLNWNAVSSATSYVVEYAREKRYFDGSSPSNVQSVTVEGVWAEITGLDTGATWWFRVKAVNSAGTSSASELLSVILGKKPSPPTTWSLKTSVVIGEAATLYWVHNTEDGSKQEAAQIEITRNGSTEIIDYTSSSQNTDEEEHTYFYEKSTTGWTSGTTIYWRVRTKGITNEFSDWSMQRTIRAYAPATLTFESSIPAHLTAYPLLVSVTAQPPEQTALRFFVSVTAEESYEALDYDGNSKWISEGDVIFSKNYNGSNNALSVNLTPSDLTLYNNISYKLTVSASMDSGMHPENTAEFDIAFEDDELDPNAEIGFDPENVSTFITPYCTDENDDPVTNVILSVYRREFDGTFTKIADGLPGDVMTAVTDPHPALDLARYRIVAISNTTGQIAFTDLPGYEIDEHAVIIQWDETWSNFDPSLDGDERPNQVGSFLRLPYNVDVSDNYSPDSSLVEYIGREHPVSYYGTQRGSTSTWNMEIERDNDETLYALRRLAIYRGDVYVREPSGSGYWANIKVSFSSKHCEVTIPVTLNISRVEGGV